MTKFALNFGYIGCCVFKTVPVKLFLRHLQDIEKVAWFKKNPQHFLLTQQEPTKWINNQISPPISTFDELSKWNDPDIS